MNKKIGKLTIGKIEMGVWSGYDKPGINEMVIHTVDLLGEPNSTNLGIDPLKPMVQLSFTLVGFSDNKTIKKIVRAMR